MRKDEYLARRMHTPDDPARAGLREALRDFSRKLLPLHRALIEAARADYSALIAPISSPGQMLQLLQEDPHFAWLKPMTTLIVDIDEMVRVDFERADFDAIVARLERLFGPTPDPAFAEHYVPVLQQDVDVAVGHAGVRQALASLARIEN